MGGSAHVVDAHSSKSSIWEDESRRTASYRVRLYENNRDGAGETVQHIKNIYCSGREPGFQAPTQQQTTACDSSPGAQHSLLNSMGIAHM